MNMQRRLSIQAVALFVFSLIPLFAYGQPQDRPGRFEEFLNLTAEQKAKLEESRKSRTEEREVQFEKMRQLRKEFREAMRDPEANESKINGLIDEMSKLRANQMKQGLARHREMRKVLTPEQQEKLSRLRDWMADRREARSFRDGRGWDRPGRRRRPFSDFGGRRQPLNRRLWYW
jgi:Spy/CpxP family protein refolding chaperone